MMKNIMVASYLQTIVWGITLIVRLLDIWKHARDWKRPRDNDDNWPRLE